MAKSQFFQRHCYLTAQLPWINCPENGFRRLQVPQTREGSYFTCYSRRLSWPLFEGFLSYVARHVEVMDIRLWCIPPFSQACPRVCSEWPLLNPVREALASAEKHCRGILQRWQFSHTNTSLEGFNGLFSGGYRNMENFQHHDLPDCGSDSDPCGFMNSTSNSEESNSTRR